MHISSSCIESILFVCTCCARVILPHPPARQSTLSWAHFRGLNRPSSPKAFAELLVKRIQLFEFCSPPLNEPPTSSSYTNITAFSHPSPGRLESGAAFLLSSSSRPFRDSFLPFKQVVVVILVVRISHLASHQITFLSSSVSIVAELFLNIALSSVFRSSSYDSLLYLSHPLHAHHVQGNSLTCRTSTLHRIISLSFVDFRVESGLLIVRVTQGRANFSAASPHAACPSSVSSGIFFRPASARPFRSPVSTLR